jgi:hypothetical protein
MYRMMVSCGKLLPRHELWEVRDVRDIAETQRLMCESSTIQNGARYFNGATDKTRKLTTTGVITLLRDVFPEPTRSRMLHNMKMATMRALHPIATVVVVNPQMVFGDSTN